MMKTTTTTHAINNKNNNIYKNNSCSNITNKYTWNLTATLANKAKMTKKPRRIMAGHMTDHDCTHKHIQPYICIYKRWIIAFVWGCVCGVHWLILCPGSYNFFGVLANIMITIIDLLARKIVCLQEYDK